MCLSFSPQPDDLISRPPPHLLINGGVASRCGHPHLLVEAVADGVGQVDAGVGVASEDGPVPERGREEAKQGMRKKEEMKPFPLYCTGNVYQMKPSVNV